MPDCDTQSVSPDHPLVQNQPQVAAKSSLRLFDSRTAPGRRYWKFSPLPQVSPSDCGGAGFSRSGSNATSGAKIQAES